MGKYEKREFQLGEYWLGQRGHSPAWCRCWYDGDSRQVRRSSLDTTDFDEAKQRLTAWFVAKQQGEKTQGKVWMLSEVFLAYHEARGQHTCNPDNVTTSGRYWLEHFGDVPAAQAAEAEATAGLREALLDSGKSPAYVNRILGVGKAALMRAHKRRMIPHAPVVEMVAGVESEPMGRPMEVRELREFFAAIRAEHVRRYFILGLGTGARNSAMLELDWSQVDESTIRLNPPGRRQTKKRRPVIPVSSELGAWLAEWRQGQTCGPVVEFWGERVQCIKTAWRATRRRSGLDKDCTPYSLRHSVGRWLRSQGVQPWECAAFLGHAMPGRTITEVYATSSPEHMRGVRAAIDSLLREVAPRPVPIAYQAA